jgi:hypothetical protein
VHVFHGSIGNTNLGGKYHQKLKTCFLEAVEEKIAVFSCTGLLDPLGPLIGGTKPGPTALP